MQDEARERPADLARYEARPQEEAPRQGDDQEQQEPPYEREEETQPTMAVNAQTLEVSSAGSEAEQRGRRPDSLP